MQARQSQVSSIRPILTHRPALTLGPGTRRPEAPAQSAPPVGGREDGTLGFVHAQRTARTDSGSRWQPIKKAISRPGPDIPPAHGTIPRMLHPTLRAVGRPSASFLALVLLVAACGPSTTPSPSVPASPAPPSSGASRPSAAPSATAAGPSASVDIDATYDAIAAQVVELRGLGPVQVARNT